MAVEGCYSKVGDVITCTGKYQVIKIYKREDNIFYLVAAVDQPKRMVSLVDGFAMVCTEFDADDKLPEMPFELLDQASAYIAEQGIDDGPAAKDEEKGGDE